MKGATELDKCKKSKLYGEFYKLPYSSMETLKTHDKTFTKIYETYKIIWTNRNKNPLYRTLKNKYINIEELAIAISSLITKFLITYSQIDDIDTRVDFAKRCGITILSDALLEYTNFNNKQPLLKCVDDVRDFMDYIDL